MPQTTETKPTIRRGDEGIFVNNLQTTLSILGYYKEPVSSIFDIPTEHAVKSFQADWNLRIDGIVGPQTWDALDRAIGGESPGKTPGFLGVLDWIQQHKVASAVITGAIIGSLYLIFRKK